MVCQMIYFIFEMIIAIQYYIRILDENFVTVICRYTYSVSHVDELTLFYTFHILSIFGK